MDNVQKHTYTHIIYIVTDCRSNRYPGNTVPLLLNGKRNRCICGNEYVPLLVIYAAMQKLVTESNVFYSTQQRTNCCVVATTIREPVIS
jgi:hypothetical protein